MLWILVVIGFLAGVFVGQQFLIHRSLGEALVASEIERTLPQPFALLNNVTLPIEGGSPQIDHVLVCRAGIFVIETKHYSGWIFGTPQQAQWTQVIYKSRKRFKNPVYQNYAHLKALQNLFKLPQSNFFSLVVFTGSAELKTDMGPDVIRLSQLSEYFGRPRAELLDERKMAYIVGRIEMKRVERSAETDEYHINYVRSRIAQRA